MIIKELKALIRDLPDNMVVCGSKYGTDVPANFDLYDPAGESGFDPDAPEEWDGQNERRLRVELD